MTEGSEDLAPQDPVGKYRTKLGQLRQSVDELGLTDLPDSSVTVDKGVVDEDKGQIEGAEIPIYSQTGTDEEGIKKAIFNVEALTGVKLRKKHGKKI